MRVTAVVPRYDEHIVGGADEYLRQLFRGLSREGVRLDVLTTGTTHLSYEGPHALRWEDHTDTRAGQCDSDPVSVQRFRTWNIPSRTIVRWSRAVEKARADAHRVSPLQTTASHLSCGFYELENWAGEFDFRWTKDEAYLELTEEGIEAVRFEVHSPYATRLTILVDGRPAEDIRVPAGEWIEAGARFEPRHSVKVCLRVTRTFQPPDDSRTLGVAVRSIGLITGSATVSLPLTRDREELLAALPTTELAHHLDREAQAWNLAPALMDMALKGPMSPGLLATATRMARRSDLVLATNAPFAAMAIGLLAGRLARRPVVLLPFLHLRDPYHHRRGLRHVLSRADRVLCLSRTTREFIEATWGAKARYVGGGIDPTEFVDPVIASEAFRERHGLGTRPVVLTVARKTPSKGYLLTCEAVRVLRQRGLPCEHVLIGPDEDRRPVERDGVRYLGCLSRPEVLSGLAACDIFALPSLYESFGLAYLEAWMFGKPVIGHRLCAPARELIEPGRDGVLVGNVAELVQALEALLSDPPRRRIMGEQGRTKTVNGYTWKHVVERTLAVFSEFDRTK